MSKAALAAASAALMLGAQPCAAAEDLRDLGSPERRSALFAGGGVRVPLGRERAAARPTMRLQLGMTHRYHDPRSAAPAREIRVGAFELGAGPAGKPAFYMGGRDVGEMEDKLGISTLGAVAIGAAVAVGALLVVAAANPLEGGCLGGDDGDC
jgi:hypothetical protein